MGKEISGQDFLDVLRILGGEVAGKIYDLGHTDKLLITDFGLPTRTFGGDVYHVSLTIPALLDCILKLKDLDCNLLMMDPIAKGNKIDKAFENKILNVLENNGCKVGIDRIPPDDFRNEKGAEAQLTLTTLDPTPYGNIIATINPRVKAVIEVDEKK